MPSTTAGRTARSSRNACQNARSSVSGSSSLVSTPLPRTPPNRTQRIGMPWRGTIEASIPPGLPIHTTLQSRSRIACATASPGITCPPVPPAMIMRVRLTRGLA